MSLSLALLSAFAYTATAQLAGNLTAEKHPPLTWSKCSSSGCEKQNGAVVVDSNWRWTHDGKGTNCYTKQTWSDTICTDGATCAATCAVEGADYEGTYGVTTQDDALTLQFVKTGTYGDSIGSRLYLMADDTTYEMFSLLNKEFSFDVDVSKLPCGLNGALYFVSMDADGGMAKNPGNQAGAQYGTGYCDAQCPRDLKWIDGVANVDGWTPSKTDKNSGIGNMGSCCPEMDIWEANSISQALTPHPCTTKGQQKCDADTCGGTYSADRYAGTCDPDGCDYNPYRMGNTSFFGPGMMVDSSSKFTVVTQFIGSPLTEIKRFYVQNGKVIEQASSDVAGVPGNSITQDLCTAQKEAFGDPDDFGKKGGLAAMGEALDAGMVLVLSLWDDHMANMLWLDSNYPTTKDASTPGVARGTCDTSSGDPATIEGTIGDSTVVFSNIKFGDLGSTFDSGSAPPPPPAGGSSSSKPPQYPGGSSSSKPPQYPGGSSTSAVSKPSATSKHAAQSSPSEYPAHSPVPQSSQSSPSKSSAGGVKQSSTGSSASSTASVPSCY